MSKEVKYRVCDKCGVMFPQENLCSECCVEGIEEYCTGHKKQLKLSIPRKIAEQADKTDFDELFQWGQEEFYQWFDHEHDKYKEVVYAYLAGKSLGVELVSIEG